MKPRSIVFVILVLVLVVVMIYRFLGWPKKYSNTFYPMGGIPCQVVEYDSSMPKFEADFEKIQSRVNSLEEIYNIYRSKSEVARLNKNEKAETWYTVSPELYGGMELSLEWFGKTNGAFDITIRPLSELWKKAEKEKKLPTQSEITGALSIVGSEYLTLSKEKGVKYARPKMELDFGGIAKGIIIDEMGKVLEENGVGKYLISCGGDVRMRGKDAFKVGVQEPGKKGDALMMILSLLPCSVVTSGHYERYFNIDGKKYSHILNPETGKPVSNTLTSITVVGKDTADADALATAIAVMGLAEAKKFLESSGEFQGVFLKEVEGESEIHYSKALEGKIEFIGKWKDVKKIAF